METRKDTPSMLSPYRALDLTDERGQFAGKLLGDMGADVIKVEPPGGDPARRIGPFFQDKPGPERSIWWWAYNSNKRGITLNLEQTAGRDLFKRLAARSDVVLESFPPGYLDSLGVGYPALGQVNKGLVFCSITPFGQTGPWRDYATGDFISHALSGNLYMTGDPKRPPLTCQMPTTYYHACADAVAGILSALWYKEATGEGQYVDVSIHECMAALHPQNVVEYLLAGRNGKRGGAESIRETPTGPVRQRDIWPCKDGFVAFSIRGGPSRLPALKRLVKWMEEEEGAPTGPLSDMDWASYNPNVMSQGDVDSVNMPFGKFFLTKTATELYEEAVKRLLILAPVYSPREIAGDKQLEARGFFQKVEHPELGASFKYPGGFVQSSETSIGIRRRSPLIGEHNEDVYSGELGLNVGQLSSLKIAGVI